MRAIFAWVIFLAGVSGFPKVWKVWVPNTNYDNPSNWLHGRLPGAADNAIFPPDLELGVTLPKGVTTLRQLVLARNGEMFLPSTGALVIAGGKGSTTQDVEWIRRGAKAWLDPSNWRNDAVDASHDALVPHMERLPCSADTVVFPANSSFRVTLPEVGVPVGTVQLEGGELSNAEWQAWLNTESGSRQFIGREEFRSTAVSVKQLPLCPDKSGCVCGDPTSHNVDYLLTVVCGYARRECAEDVPCYSPIKPVGHCCDACGGYLVLEIQPRQFDMEAMRQLVNKYLTNKDFPGVSGHVGRTSVTHAQIVVVDRAGHYEENSVRLAAILAQDIRDGNVPGVLSVKVHTSGARVLGSRWAAATSTMFGTLFAVVVCMGLVYFLFIVHPITDSRFARLTRLQNVAQPFRFARFENLGGDGEAALRLESESAVDEVASDPSRQSFDNPLYRQAKIEEEASEDKDRDVTHENPVYSELKRKEKANTDGSDEDDDDDEDEEETETEVEEKFDEIVFGE